MNEKVQIIRALAIMAVVAIHTPAPEPWVVFIRPFFNFAVAMFLFLSGYLTASKVARSASPDFPALIKNRLRRIVPTYALWVLLTSLPFILLQLCKQTCTPVSALGIVLNQSCGVPYYFFLVYFQLLLLHPWIERLAASRFRTLGMLLTPAAICGLYYMHIASIHLPGMGYAMFFPVWFGYYYLGVILGQRKEKPAWNPSLLAFIWLATCALQWAEGWFWYTEGSIDMATSQLRLTSFLSSNAAILLAYACINLPKATTKPKFIKRTLILIGNCSMGIFLSHCMMIPIWNHTASFLHIPTPYPIKTVAVLTASLVLILLANRLLPSSLVALIGFSCGKATAKRT